MINVEAKEFLIMNPLLFCDLDKYIWIDDSFEAHRNAQCLFDYLLRRNIYVKGFVSRSTRLVGLKMFNKNILDFDALDAIAMIFSDTNFRPCKVEVSAEIQKARVINLPHDENDIIIWGSGITGDWVYQLLRGNGFTVRCFVDADINKQGAFKYNLPICKPEKLDEFEEDIIVIEALEKWRFVDETIREKKWKRFYFCFEPMLTDITCSVGGTEKKLFRLSYFWMFHHFVGKKIYIYGNGAIEREFALYLKLMDYHFAGFLVDDMENCDDENCQYIEEILYEDNFFIWIYDKGKKHRLTEMGLKCLLQWECNEQPWDVTLNRREGLDINLGYTSLVDGKYPGIVVYGEEKEDNYKIAILGGSTSDGVYYPFKAWPELLYEDLKARGVTIYNCGVSGYSSEQELIKMIRDVIPLRPNMIIVYDGANELGVDVEHPFSFLYMKKVFDFAKRHVEEAVNVEYMQMVSEGIALQMKRFDEWLHNIRGMYALASEYGIRFFSFCQPLLSCKKGKSIAEKNILLSMPSHQIDLWSKEYFRKYLEQRKDIPDYIYDFTGIFDNVDDVFMDICHVKNEKGNRIIADRIKDVIYDTVFQNDNRQSRI